jgi:hypothetical protein
MPTTSRARRRADRLATLHRELRTLIRKATVQRQADLFDPATPEIKTREATTADRTVTLSLRETFDLFRAAMPPTAHDASTRRTHAMLIITLRHLLDTLRAIDSNEIPPASIAAAELVGKQVRTWLRQAERSTQQAAKRRAIWAERAKAQTTLLLPLNRRTLLRQETTPLHNAVPVRSRTTLDSPPAQPDFSQSETINNESPTAKRRKA